MGAQERKFNFIKIIFHLHINGGVHRNEKSILIIITHIRLSYLYCTLIYTRV